MKKHASARRADNDLKIPELGPDFFKNAVRGKYYAKLMAGSNVVRIAPDLHKSFPNEEVVNKALREMLRIRTALSEIAPTSKRRKSA